jgi:endo-beta-N-acetylglucosaminidase D
MKLLTEKIKKQIPALYSTDDTPIEEKTIICKFFNPTGLGTWYVVEGEEQEDGDWLFFGLVDLFEKEWGYFTLNELKSVRGVFGLGIERDMHFENEPMEKFA